MILIPELLEVPLYLIILGIILCLIFEAAGVPEGFRRHGNRNYLSLIAGVVISVVFFLILRAQPIAPYIKGGMIFDPVARSAILSLGLLVLMVLWIIVERLKPLNRDRGEVYALTLFSYFACILISCAHDITLAATGLIAWPCGQLGILAIQKKRRASPEVALKLIVLAAFMLIFLAVIFILVDSTLPTVTLASSHRGAIIILISLVLLVMGSVPLQSMHVDVLDGAPSYVAAFFGGATFITSSAILIRLVEVLSGAEDIRENLYFVFVVLAAVSMCLAPIMALDQKRISRLLAYLLSSQAGLVLICASLGLHTESIPSYFYGFLFTHFSLCAGGAYAGLNFWKDAKHSFKSWEDFAGAGRKHPLAAGAFFFILASIGGLPFTAGFIVRHHLLDLTPSIYRFPILLIFIVSTVLCAVPIFRLLAFFFGKATRHELRKHHRPRQIILLIFCALALLLFSVAPTAILESIFG